MAQFIDELLDAADRAGVRREIQAVLQRWAGQRLTIPAEGRRAEQAERAADVARRLVFSGVGTRAASAMVRDRFGISARHARRLVRAAVDMRGQRMSGSGSSMWP